MYTCKHRWRIIVNFNSNKCYKTLHNNKIIKNEIWKSSLTKKRDFKKRHCIADLMSSRENVCPMQGQLKDLSLKVRVWAEEDKNLQYIQDKKWSALKVISNISKILKVCREAKTGVIWQQRINVSVICFYPWLVLDQILVWLFLPMKICCSN